MTRRFFLITLTAILLLSACSCAPEPVILSESEISVLRESYPVADTLSHGSVSFEQAFYLSCAIVTAEMNNGLEFGRRDAKYNKELYPSIHAGVYLPVTINKVLHGDGVLSEGDEIRIYLGSGQFFSAYDAFTEGRQYIFFVTPGQDISAYYDDTVFGGGEIFSAYITDDGYILPVTEKGPFETYKGYSLDSYEDALPTLIKAAQKATRNKTREEILYSS